MLSTVDVNCDMGEGRGLLQVGTADELLLPHISSANIATGFHAGDPMLMDRLARACHERGIGIGAHPSFRDLHGFGRRFIRMEPAELVNDVLYQVGAMQAFAQRHGGRLQHVKLHGALYMHAAADEAFSQALVEGLQQIGPELLIYCMDVSATYRVARAAGMGVVREFYADRDYDKNGAIVFTRQVAAPLDPRRVADKIARACSEGRVQTVAGDEIEIGFDSICFHSDTPAAAEVGRATREALQAAGVTVAPPTR